MKLFCANCGLPLHHYRKALKDIGAIIDLVNYHQCVEVPIPFDIKNFPDAAPFIPIEGKEKFAKDLNTVVKKQPQSITPPWKEGDELCDRRFENDKIKNSAPITVLDQIKSMTNSIPVHKGLEPESED